MIETGKLIDRDILEIYSLEITPQKLDVDTKRLTELLTRVFQLQPLPNLIFTLGQKDKIDGINSVLPTAHQIASQFYDNKYVEMKLHCGLGVQELTPEN
jgi:hypothetical protein